MAIWSSHDRGFWRSELEALYPGTRRYLTTSMWPLLDGEDRPTDLLFQELALCPALGDHCGPQGAALDFDALLRAMPGDKPTFWTLEALVLLTALAVKAGDRPAGLAIFDQFQSLKTEISLPKDVEERRRELMSFCLHFMHEPWVNVEAVEAVAVIETELCIVPIPVSPPSGERVFDAAGATLGLGAEGPPLALLHAPMSESSDRRLFRDGRYPRWVVALLSAILVPILAFEKSDMSVFYIFILLAFWVTITAAAFFPKIGRWSITR